MIYMGRPSCANRLRILQVHAKDKPIDRTHDDAVLSKVHLPSSPNPPPLKLPPSAPSDPRFAFYALLSAWHCAHLHALMYLNVSVYPFGQISPSLINPYVGEGSPQWAEVWRVWYF